MGKTFEECFFCFPHPLNPILDLPGTPAPKWPCYPITKNEVDYALTKTSNKSALGPSSIGYKLVKWAFRSHPNLILDIYNAVLCLGYHPWMTAKVVIIPKPNKPDYSAAKAYRPVSLLECFSKVFKKIIANHFTSDSNLHNILPPSQFSSQPYHSATDTCNLLHYKASTMINSGQIGGILLFNISRFFDHLNPAFTTRVLHHLGIDDQTIA